MCTTDSILSYRVGFNKPHLKSMFKFCIVGCHQRSFYNHFEPARARWKPSIKGNQLAHSLHFVIEIELQCNLQSVTGLLSFYRANWNGLCLLIRHFIKAWQNFRKARYLWYAEKLFWFMAKVLGFVIYKWSASNEDFLKSSWIRQSSNLNFPPLEYVSDFEPGSLADQWQWSKVWVNQSQRRSTTAAEAAPSTTHK